MSTALDGRVAIVTGAGRGVGAAIAYALANAGARVAVNDLNPDRAARVAATIRQRGGGAIDVAADVSNKFQCVHLIETTRAEWGRLDILVNNASVRPKATVLKMDEWDWERCISVNLKSTFFMSQLCGRVMAEENGEQGGIIVNVASTAGVLTPLPFGAAYCASQAGIVGFARECAREFAPYGIRVNTVLPGIIRAAAGEPQPGTPAAANLEWDSVPMGRPGTPEEVARVVLFLCSSESSYMTGSTVPVTGGLVMP